MQTAKKGDLRSHVDPALHPATLVSSLLRMRSSSLHNNTRVTLRHVSLAETMLAVNTREQGRLTSSAHSTIEQLGLPHRLDV